ncbi:MAG: hypothetical protein AB1Z19_06565 [Eubacteriales bacterium]
MRRVVKTMLILVIVMTVLIAAVSVYAGNGSSRGTGSGSSRGGQSTRVGDTARELCDEDCTEEAYAVEAGNGNRNGDRGIIGEYAEMTGQDVDDVHDTMRDSDLDIWELAEQEGNFQALKAIELAHLDEHIATTTDAETLQELIAHRNAVLAATTAAEMPEDYDGYENSADGERRGRRR